MGSAIEVQIALEDPARAAEADAAIAASLTWIVDAEARLSRFIPTSELSALNRSAGRPFPASPDLFALVTAALDWRDRTEGLFDPTLLLDLVELGYDASMEGGPTPGPSPSADGEGRSRRGVIHHAPILLDPLTRAITLPAGMGIDLGGIGKGWAADAVLARVLGDFPHGLVNIGGDLAVRGGPEPEGWVIGARDPRVLDLAQPVYLGGVRLRAGGIATSGPGWRWWWKDGERQHHLIDPRTRRPAQTVSIDGAGNAVLSVTALAHTATEAEVRAKEALLLGMRDGLARLAEADDRAGWFICADGSIHASANLPSYLAKLGG